MIVNKQDFLDREDTVILANAQHTKLYYEVDLLNNKIFYSVATSLEPNMFCGQLQGREEEINYAIRRTKYDNLQEAIDQFNAVQKLAECHVLVYITYA